MKAFIWIVGLVFLTFSITFDFKKYTFQFQTLSWFINLRALGLSVLISFVFTYFFSYTPQKKRFLISNLSSIFRNQETKIDFLQNQEKYCCWAVIFIQFIDLIILFKNLDDATAFGPAMAVFIVATLYSLLLIFLSFKVIESF